MKASFRVSCGYWPCNVPKFYCPCTPGEYVKWGADTLWKVCAGGGAWRTSFHRISFGFLIKEAAKFLNERSAYADNPAKAAVIIGNFIYWRYLWAVIAKIQDSKLKTKSR